MKKLMVLLAVALVSVAAQAADVAPQLRDVTDGSGKVVRDGSGQPVKSYVDPSQCEVCSVNG